MIRRLWARWGRWATWAAVFVLVPAAVLLAFVGVDLIRAQDELTSDDRRFQTTPMRQSGLWDVGLLPNGFSERLLGLDDDIAYRKAAGLYVRVEPGRVTYDGFPELERLRAKAQFDLTRMSQEDPEPKRRSRLLTLYGVMTLDTRTASATERENILRNAGSAFRTAIALDPTNNEAKTNLEALLSTFGPIAFPPNAPSQGQSQGRVSGQGRAGSGY